MNYKSSVPLDNSSSVTKFKHGPCRVFAIARFCGTTASLIAANLRILPEINCIVSFQRDEF